MGTDTQRDEKRVRPFLVHGTNCTTMRARGLIGKRPVNLLIDTGAAISVICHANSVNNSGR